jgi:hypothetical protein
MTAVTRVEPRGRHGRRERRQRWALADPALCYTHAGEAGVHEAPWSHLGQVCRVRRQQVKMETGECQKEVSYDITRLGPDQADAPHLRRLLLGHWGIKNRLHWVRDVTFDEDRCSLRRRTAGRGGLSQPRDRARAPVGPAQHRRRLTHLRGLPLHRQLLRLLRRLPGDEMPPAHPPPALSATNRHATI